MRHLSITLFALLLGCSGTPVSAPIHDSVPAILPAPAPKDFNLVNGSLEVDNVISFRNSLDTYISYLQDYSRRLSEQHGFVSKHKGGQCPIALVQDPLIIQSPPITAGLDESETIDALLDYIETLRAQMVAHNRTGSLLVTKRQEICDSLN